MYVPPTVLHTPYPIFLRSLAPENLPIVEKTIELVDLPCVLIVLVQGIQTVNSFCFVGIAHGSRC